MLFKRKMYIITYENFISPEKKRTSCVSAFTQNGAIKKVQKYYFPFMINILDIKEAKL